MGELKLPPPPLFFAMFLWYIKKMKIKSDKIKKSSSTRTRDSSIRDTLTVNNVPCADF